MVANPACCMVICVGRHRTMPPENISTVARKKLELTNQVFLGQIVQVQLLRNCLCCRVSSSVQPYCRAAGKSSPISILLTFPVREEGEQTEVEKLYKHFGSHLCLVSELLWVYPTTLSIILTRAPLSFVSNKPQAITRTRAIKMVFRQNARPRLPV